MVRVKGKSVKAGLKVNTQKTKIVASGPITSWQIDRGKVKAMTDFFFSWTSKSLPSDYSHELKRHLLLEEKL